MTRRVRALPPPSPWSRLWRFATTAIPGGGSALNGTPFAPVSTVTHRILLALTAALAVMASGCGRPATAPEPDVPLTFEQPLCTGNVPRPCLPPSRVEAWLRDPALRIVDSDRAHRGIQKAVVLTLSTRSEGHPIVFRAKWRPQSAAKTNYSEPRVAIATYALQKRLVSEAQYVIPPTVGHCFDLGSYRLAVDAEATPTGTGGACVWGSLSYWLESVRQLDEVEGEDWYHHDEGYDQDLYGRSQVYRNAISTINLLTYLARSGDAHRNQFLIRPDPLDPHVYLVDNSMGFGAKVNSDLVGTGGDWTQVLADLPAEPLEVLFSWEAADYRELQSIERYRLVGGRLEPMQDAAQPTEPIGHAPDGLTARDGVLHVGLTDVEIAAVRGRVEQLKSMRRHGQLKVVRLRR